MRWLTFGLLLLWPGLCAGELAAAVSASASSWTLRGSAAYRLLAVGLDDIAVDETGTELGQNSWLEQRLRLLAAASYRDPLLRFELGGDLFSGLLAGDTTQVGADFRRDRRDAIEAHRRFEPRRALVAWRSPIGELRVGHQVSNWGYGILANSGEHELDFGDQRFGDLVERVALITRPLDRLFVAGAFDLVYRDRNAELLEGDVGLNAIGSLFLRDARGFFGLYIAHRNQWDDDDDRVRVTAIDLHGLRRGELADDLRWEVGFEAMLLVGSTSRQRPEPDLDETSVLAGGAVARAVLAHAPSRVTLTMEAGLATGDNDRNDDTTRQASFHPDYRVGLILFRELLGGLTARAADRLADPANVAQAPHGTEHVPTDGAVHNTVYLWPRIAFRLLGDLQLQAGLLYAHAVADLIDPYTTNLRGGGSNRNYYDGPADGGDLGIETQLGARYDLDLGHALHLQLAVQWAHLFVGAAFRSASGPAPEDIDRVGGRLLLSWSYN